MENLPRIVAAYKAMDQRRRDYFVAMMEDQAKKYPDKEKVLLRLVSSKNRS